MTHRAERRIRPVCRVQDSDLFDAAHTVYYALTACSLTGPKITNHL